MKNAWIKTRLADIRGSQKALAQALNIDPPRISEVIKGTREVQQDELVRMANYLQLPLDELVALLTGETLRVRPINPIMVRGAVQAGIYSESFEWPHDEWRSAPVAYDDRYPPAAQFGLEVRGNSMNEVYPAGTVLVCVSLIHFGRNPRVGERVIVQRTHPDNGAVESTVKELKCDESGQYWLWPRSTDPKFQQPWLLSAGIEAAHEDSENRVIAVVIGSYRPE